MTEKQIISLRLEPDTIATIDAIVGKQHRSEFIRDAVDQALDGKPKQKAAPKPKKEKRVVQQPNRQGKSVAVDGHTLLALVTASEGGISAKNAKEQLGWMPMRFDRAERALLQLDLITSVSGYLYA